VSPGSRRSECPPLPGPWTLRLHAETLASRPDRPALEQSQLGHATPPECPTPPHAPTVSVTRSRIGFHKDTTRCASSVLKYKCAICHAVRSEWDLVDHCRCCHAGRPTVIAPEVLDAGSLARTSKSRQLRSRFGGSSVFGFHRLFRIFNLPASRSE
jgi:hypothetical protein